MRNDVLAELAALDPVTEQDLPDAYGPDADALLAEILSAAPEGEVTTARPPRPSRRRWLLVPAAALLLLGAALVLAQPSPNPQEINCYREASPYSDRVALHVDLDDRDPVGACEGAWAAEELWADPVPDSFATCVTEAGMIAVVPGPEGAVCAELGWPAFDAEDSPTEVLALHGLIAEHYAADECVPLEEALRVARDALGEAGLEDDWDIVVAESVSGDTPCVSLAVDGEGQRVRVAPEPRFGD